MSRVGKKVIAIPQGVQISVAGNVVTVKGPKGTLTQELSNGVSVRNENGELIVENQDQEESQFHGLYRALINNMVVGVSTGFSRKLELIGVGYRAAVQGQVLDLQLGFSHPTRLEIPQGLSIAVEKNTVITVTGIDKQRVGQFSAEIRAIRPPEPYKGKGVRYEGEYVRKKAGKTTKGKGK